MKGESTSCKECGTRFVKKRNKHFYCSKRCCNEYNRKKRGEPLPDFLKNKKTSKMPANVGRSNSVPTNPIYNGVVQMGISLEQEEQLLNIQKQRLLRRYLKIQDKITNKNGIVKNTGQFVGMVGGATVGHQLAGEITDSPLIKAIMTIGFGIGAGYTTGQMLKDVNSPEFKALRNIEIDIEEIDKRLNTIGLKKVAVRGFKRKIPKHAKEKGTVLTATEFNKIENATYTFSDKWEVLGNPERNFSMMVYGEPDAGKSHFIVQLASYLSQLPTTDTSEVLFIPFEERDSRRLQQKFKRYGYKGSVLPYDETIQDVINVIKTKKPKFVFIDSINEVGFDIQSLKMIRNQFPKIAVIFVVQVTKDGKFKGGKELEHFANIKVNVTKNSGQNVANITGKYSTGKLPVFDNEDYGNRVLSKINV